LPPYLLRPLVSSALALCLALAGPQRVARADEVQACIEASDKGQTLRIDKRLREAREQFAACARQSCPEAVRDRCAGWLEQSQRAVPTIVFVVKDDAGNDASPVRVTLDGARVTERYDGTALLADPGEHTFRFEWAGHAPVERVFRLVEGEQSRRERVVFERPASAGDPAPGGSEAPGSAARTAAFVSGGAGLAGLGVGALFGVLAITRNSAAHCNAANVCENPEARRDAQGVATVSTVGFIAGGVLLAAGAVLWFTAPSGEASPARVGLGLSPLLAPGTAGLSLRGGF